MSVDPLLVAEIVVDNAVEYVRWRHAMRHVHIRTDLGPGDVPLWTPTG